MQFDVNADIIAPPTPTKKTERFPPYVAVFEKDGKSLVYLAECHSILNSFDMVDGCLADSKLPRPDVLVLEQGNPLPTIGSERFDLEMGRIKTAMKQNQNAPGYTNIKFSSLAYGGMRAMQCGIPVVCADLSDAALENLLRTESNGRYTDLAVAVRSNPHREVWNLSYGLMWRKLLELYPAVKFSVGKLQRILMAGVPGGNTKTPLEKLDNQKILNAWRQEYPDMLFGPEQLKAVLDAGATYDKGAADFYFGLTRRHRDPLMLSHIADALNKYNVVWCHMGEGHFRSQYKNLVAWLGGPKYYIDYTKGRDRNIEMSPNQNHSRE